MSGTLYVVATPIGNLEDITLRALRVLGEVAVVAAEDTRRTARLLHHHGISTPTVSFHAHNTRTRVPELLGRLGRGESVALVSDAGTPVLSDPGLELIQAAIENEIPVDPIPGASAILAALVASGLSAYPVTFLGFAPARAKDRMAWYEALNDITHTAIFFEAPHRIRASLSDAAFVLGNRPLVLARELTKVHQEVLRGPASQLVKRPLSEKGEYTVVVGPQVQTVASKTDALPGGDVAEQFRQLTESSRLTRRQAIAELARRHHRPAREIYATLEEAKRGLP